MTRDDVIEALAAAGFCGIEAEGAAVYARVAPQAPEFRAEPLAEPMGDGWQLVLPWNVTPPVEAMALWNRRMGEARMDVLQGEARLVMPLPGREVLPRWAALAGEAEAHFIVWRRGRRDVEGM